MSARTPALKRADVDLPAAGLTAVNVEAGIYAILIAAAAFFRLVQLGGLPLTPNESTLAYSGWAVAHQQMPFTWPVPSYQSLTAALLWLFGGDDAIARLVPAVAGIALVGLVWPLRPLIGRPAALLAAAYFAISPLLTAFSRQAGGETLALAALLGLTALLFRASAEPRPVQAAGAGGLLALLLVSGPLGVSLLIALIVFLAVASLARDRFAAVWRPIEGVGRNRPSLIAALGAFGAVFILLSTGWLGYPEGFGLSSLGAWASGFDLTGSDLPWWYQWAQIAVAEPAALVFGLIGGVAVVRRLVREWQRVEGPRDLLAVWLIVWAVFGLLMAGLAPGTAFDQALVPLVPLVLLGAAWLAGWPAGVALGADRPAGPRLTADPEVWRRSPWVIAALPLLFFEAILLSKISVENAPGGFGLWALFWVGLALLIGVVFAPWLVDLQDGFRVTVTAGLILLLVPTIGLLGRIGPRQETNSLISPTVHTSPDVRRLLGDVRLAAGYANGGQARPIAVENALLAPLGWYLKDYPNVFFGPTQNATSPVVIRPADLAGSVPAGAAQRQAILLETWRPEAANLAVVARWLILDRPPAPTQFQKVILYANP